MPVLDTERRSATRSALRYRPLPTTDQATSDPIVSRTRRVRADARETLAPVVPDDLEQEVKRLPRRRPVAPVSRKASAPPGRARRRHAHPLFFIGLGLVLTLLLWTGIAQALSWGTSELNLLKYGNPPTFQVDAVVGQGDSTQHPSHFAAVNLRGIVTILEWPGSDPSHVRVLAATSVPGPNADQVVVTLQFVDVNHNNTPDMLININGVQSVLVNDGTTFRPPTPIQQQQLLQELQHQP